MTLDIEKIEVGKIILEAIKNKGINKKELSEMIGVSKSTITDWTKNRKTYNMERLIRLIKILDLVPIFFPENTARFTIIEQKEYEDLKKRLNKMEEELRKKNVND